MPLSEHEQRVLDQIERALYQDDPKFATSVRSTDLRTHTRRRLRRAGILLAVGLALMIGGVAVNTALAFVGFVVMFGALLMALSNWRKSPPPAATLHSVDPDGRTGRDRRTDRPGKGRGKSSGSGSMLGRWEERWNKRWDERGRDQ